MSSITDTRTQMFGKQGKRKTENPLLNDAASKRAKRTVSSFRPQILSVFPNRGSNSRPIATIDDSEVEHDVRAMDDETDHLRRNSRAHSTIESSLQSTNPALQFDSNATSNLKRNKELRKSTNGLRKSSSGRGKRISSSFEATGVLYQPHNSVSDSSFYKHIDVDLPDSERIRQLLIWSSLRASTTPTSSTSQPASSSSQPPPPPPLPPLSAKAVQVLKSVQADVVKMLAEKRIDLSLYSPEAASSSKTKVEDLVANEQNVRNRHWEVTYSDHIKQADAENEAWKEVGFKYKAYGERLQASLQERTAALYKPDDSLHPETRHADEIEAELDKRLGSALEFKIDQISSFINAARVTTYIAEKALNERFDIIASNLKSRLNPLPPLPPPSATADSTQMLTTYITNSRSTAIPDPLDLMRALTRVDKERPPAMVTDAARRAAREVQRVGESGVGAVGKTRLTGVPVTPKKTPGTPRRGNTPGRDR